MKVLIVCSYKLQYVSHIAPFIEEQVASLRNQGVVVDYFLIRKKGLFGYLLERKRLIAKIQEFSPDVIHAHFGLSGLLANLQRSIPVVTTYHGSDINDDVVFRFSKLSMRLSAWNIFVSKKNLQKSTPKKNFILLPCGISFDDFPVMEKVQTREKLGWRNNDRYVLFAGAFDNHVKNAPLAKDAVELLSGGVHLVEMKGYMRVQMATLFCASDVFLMTSFSEGSPQVIKEAMACGCPIVSVDVGDVAERINGVAGCFLAERNANDIAQKLQYAFDFKGRTEGRSKIEKMGLDNREIAEKLKDIYKIVIH